MTPARRRLHLVSDDQSTVHIGHWFRRCREDAGLTQEQAAGRAGITRNALAALEKRALPNPGLKTMLSLMRAYDLDSIEALLGPARSVQLAAAWTSVPEENDDA